MRNTGHYELGEHDKWGFYQDEEGANVGQWRWRRTAPNGEPVGASTESYVNKDDCIANAVRNGYDLDNGAHQA